MSLVRRPIPNFPVPDWQAVDRIPIRECNEGFQTVSLSPRLKAWPVYFKMNIPHAIPECYIRKGVYRRLLRAGGHLPDGLTLVVFDGWRPIKVQRFLYETFLGLLKQSYPEWDEAMRINRARQLIAPPSTNLHAPSPHVTGGSVDVTLMRTDGALLDMGTLFDEASPLAFTAALEDRDDLSAEKMEARDNRRLLYYAMIQAGFTNLPTEWWHYDFGNQMWSWHGGRAEARYGLSHPHTLDV